MHRISWIFGIGAMLLVACAVEPSATTPPSPSSDGAATSTAATANLPSDPPASSAPASCFLSCLAQCDPNDGFCGEACRCLCFGAEYCP
jgi:hypothetical protein